MCLNLSYFTSIPLCSILCYLLRFVFQFTKIILFRCVKSASNLCTFFYTNIILPLFFFNCLSHLQLFILFFTRCIKSHIPKLLRGNLPMAAALPFPFLPLFPLFLASSEIFSFQVSHVQCLVSQLCLTLCSPMKYSPPGSSVHGDSPGKNIRMGCRARLQGIFPTQGSNPGLPHCS